MARIIVFLFALVAGGCGFRTAEEFIISPEFTPEQQEAIIAAADEWCEVAGACVPVSVGEPANVVLGNQELCGEYGAGARTYYDPIKAPDIHICAEKVGDKLFTVALHEMGHTIAGSTEHTEPGTVMCSTTECAADHITDSDIDYVNK